MVRQPSIPVVRLLAGLAVIYLTPAAVRAESHRLCLYLDLGTEFWDASPRAADGRDFDEEYGRYEGPTSYPAQRWLARIRDESADEVVFGWHPLDGSGCAEFGIAGDTDLTIEWVRWAAWEDSPETGNNIIGYDCDPSMSSCTLMVPRTVTLPVNTAAGTTEVIVSTSIRPVDLVFWAASFAEERFASLGEQPLVATRMYVSYDPLNVLPGATQADRTFGNQPSVVIQGKSYHSKFTVAHELGHQQTIAAARPGFGANDVDYCYDSAAYPLAPPGCTPNHAMQSHEWQAAAAVEGIAHWYAVATWNDVDLVECMNCQQGVRFVAPSAPDVAQTFNIPRQTPLCTAIGQAECPPGVGNEWDWASGFSMFRTSVPPPTLRSIFGMVSAAYATGNWPPNAPNDAFWVGFSQAMVSHLGPSKAAWDAAASQMELDR
jgi:hypothetical protein